MYPSSISLRTPAKINLFLEVVARREDGYREIETVFLPVNTLCDEVTVSLTPDENSITFECDHPDVPQDERNLCRRASRLFADTVGELQAGWHIRLDKDIPVAAGLGGASSDAAAVLKLLNQMHDHPLSRDTLKDLARKLGADVPFFLNPCPALATGVGEKLQPLACSGPVYLVLVNPRFPVSAGWAYQHSENFGHIGTHHATVIPEALHAADTELLGEHLFNRLEFPVCYKFPFVDMILEFLRDHGCIEAHVSGSGPTVFGLCHHAQPEQIVHEVADAFGGAVWVRSAAYLPENEKPALLAYL